MSSHKNLTGTNIHTPITYTYADSTEREAATGFTSNDLYKFSRQEDDDTVYILIATTPTWRKLGGSETNVQSDWDETATSDDSFIKNKPDISGLLEREDWGQNGFTTKTTSTLTFTDNTRTFSIQPTSSSFEYLEDGVKYTSTGDTIVLTDVEGIHVIYYDEDILTDSVNPAPYIMSMLMRSKTLISIIYWDTSEQEAIYVGEERHGHVMSPSTHSYLHYINGLEYMSGLGLVNMDVDATGDVNSDAQFGLDSGEVTDEDLYMAISAVGVSTGLPIHYMLGSAPTWEKQLNTGYSVRTYDNTNNTRLCYNEFTGGSWQLTEVNNRDFVLCHVFATTEKDKPMIAVMGQDEYSNLTLAREGAKVEIQSLILNDILFPEIRPIATIIYQTDNGYDNDVKGRVRTTDDGDDYIDWRSESVSRTQLTSSDHNALSGLQLAATGNTYGHIDDQSQIIAGTKTFTDGIAISSNVPASATSTGIAGQIEYNSDYMYICIATDTWKRVAISTWT